MRLVRHLNESYQATPEQIEEMFKVLQKDCAPFLQELRKSRKAGYLYRGLKRGLKIYPKTALEDLTVRKNRKPSDIPKNVHNYIGSEMKRKFGWNARTEGVFATSSFMTASEFGIPYLFFPVGKLKFVYSPQIKDLLGSLERHGVIEWKMGKFWPVYGALSKDKMEDEIDYVIKDYTDKNLANAISMRSEIVFNCNKYYLTDKDNGYDLDDLIWGK